MGRVHLFEFGDQKWFPSFLRNYMTDFLQFLSNKTKLYRPVIPVILKGLEHSGTNSIIDLGSGGGGGLLWLNSELKKTIPDLKIVLTDYYPNIPAFARIKSEADNFEYREEPVDARKVPENLKGLRTQFLSLHHFRPADARQILQNAVDSSSAIAVFEGQERGVPSIIAMLISPVSVILTTPFIRPFSFGRLVFTYLLPLVPLFTLWDGVISSLRTYSVKEMNSLVNEVDGSEAYDWDIGRLRSGPGIILYLLGTKKQKP